MNDDDVVYRVSRTEHSGFYDVWHQGVKVAEGIPGEVLYPIINDLVHQERERRAEKIAR